MAAHQTRRTFYLRAGTLLASAYIVASGAVVPFAMALLFTLGCVVVVFALTTDKRRVQVALGILAVACAMTAVLIALRSDPLKATVVLGKIEHVPLSNTLQQLLQRTDARERWVILVYGSDVAARDVDFTFHTPISVRQALDRICDQTHCAWRWSWYSLCGTVYSPSRILVKVWAADRTPTAPCDKEVWIEYDSIVVDDVQVRE